MRERAKRTINRILRNIVAGGALALRPEDLRDVEADLVALLATGEGTETDLSRTLFGLYARVSSLLKKRDAELASVKTDTLNAALEELTRLGRRGDGGFDRA